MGNDYIILACLSLESERDEWREAPQLGGKRDQLVVLQVERGHLNAVADLVRQSLQVIVSNIKRHKVHQLTDASW